MENRKELDYATGGFVKETTSSIKDVLTSVEYKELQFQVTPQMKYRNQKVEIDGYKFASRREANRYGRLKLLKQEGSVIDFKMQVKYPIVINNQKICVYIGDFEVLWRSGKTTVEDCKGMKTSTYALKKKLVKAVLGIVIKEI